jgi:hypothetical protein
MDSGSGTTCGVYAQKNSTVQPIFEAWLKPFNDLVADTVTLRASGDHLHHSILVFVVDFQSKWPQSPSHPVRAACCKMLEHKRFYRMMRNDR